MGFRHDSEDNGKWWELLIAWKWPHQGFTIGYDFIEQQNQPEENEMAHHSILLYLGPLSIMYNFGYHE